MKKFTVLLLMAVALCGMQSYAAPAKAPSRSAIFNSLPSGFQQLGNTSIYYNVSARDAAGPGTQTGFSILGKIGNQYYSSTYEGNDVGFFNTTYGEGAGFIGAFQVNNGTAVYLNAASGTTTNGVRMTAQIEPQGEVAARITYTLTNNNNQAVTINAGVWADIMIGDNDNAPLERLVHDGSTYGLKLKYSTSAGAPLMCALFGDGITGVTPADNYWFGQYRNNYQAAEIVGVYDNIYEHEYEGWFGSYYFEDEVDPDYMVENGNYDSGMGFCWRNRTIEAGGSIELSYVVSVGEIEFEEPIVPGDDVFTYNVEAYDFDGWNDLDVAHPAHVWGYYEHPYGQEGYIEFMVDGTRGEWTRIPTALVSGEGYDLPFDMFFDPEVTDVHTLQLRFTDGLGNYVNLNGLEWVDVRSYTVEDVIPTFPYDGSPKTFEVIVNGEPVLIGGDGQYVNPGTYTVVVAEGEYDENTIGMLTITFAIENTTGVEEITVVKEDGAWYTIDGHRVVAPTAPGIYIHNGKKYIVK